MATLTINGREVTVDDSFLSLSPEQQDATVDEIAASMGSSKTEKTGHSNVPEFDPGVPGYNPVTGMIEHKAQPSQVTAALGGVLNGIPIAGPYLKGGTEQVAAALGSLISGRPRSEVLREMRADVDASREAYPITTMAAEIGGAVAGTAPMIVAAPSAFGVGAAKTLGQLGARSLASGATGGALGAADSAVRSGGDLEEIKRGGLVGAGTGLVGPIFGKGVGESWRGISDLWMNRTAARAAQAGVDKSVLSTVGRALRDDGIDPAVLQQRMADLGPEGMLLDVGPNLQQQAAGLASLPGRGQKIIKEAVTARDVGANARIAEGVDSNFGRAVVLKHADKALEDAQKALGPAYDDAFQNASRVDTSAIANNLDSQAVNLRGPAQAAAKDVRRMLNIAGADQLDPNPATLFQTRQAIDGMLATNADPNALRILSSARKQVDDLLARNVPGIKEVDAQFAELARQREALGRGQQVLDSGKTAPRPQELAQEFADAVQPQGRQIGPSASPLRIQQGARAEIDRALGTKANDLTALKSLIKGEGDWNRARLSTVFGPEKTDAVINLLDREKLFSGSSDAVTRNSLTASRNAAQSELGEAGGKFGNREGFISGGTMGFVRGTAMKAADKVADALMKGRIESRNTKVAEALISRDPSRIVNALASKSTMTPQQEKLIEVIARSIMLGNGAVAARP